MKITKEGVEHVAKLARLSLSEDERERYTKQMDSILTYIEKLNELDTEGVAQTAHSVSIANPMRGDDVKESLSREGALLNAPEEEEGCFKVPKIIEEG